ncbi:MAG TPA: putrescine aminotransferase [Clostridiales bacterium]|nr:putrescine aminotransferase [Clostridiales bacterium]
MNKTSSVLSLIAKWAILVVVLTAIYLPLLMIVAYSFSSAQSVGGEYGNFTFSLYKKLFENKKLLDAAKNTLIIGLTSAFLATALGTTAAVGIHYMRKKTKAVVDSASQITVVNAEIVTAMGFFLLMIFLRDAIKLPVNFNIVWLIIAHTVITTPYVILTVSPRLKQLNPNLLEASMDLGAGPMRSLITVMLPQLAGAMISGFALAFTLSLDDFVITNINSFGSNIDTISTFVYSGIRKKGIPNEIRALSTIIFVVVLVVLIVYNAVKLKNDKKSKKKI